MALKFDFFLACLYCQKQFKTKILITYGIILILKSVLKERTYKKVNLLKQNIFVQTQNKTMQKTYLLQYILKFVMLQKRDTFNIANQIQILH